MYCEVVDSLWAFGLFHTVQPRGADVLSWKTESPTPRVAADQPPPNITFTYTTNLKGVINYDFETERWYRMPVSTFMYSKLLTCMSGGSQVGC